MGERGNILSDSGTRLAVWCAALAVSLLFVGCDGELGLYRCSPKDIAACPEHSKCEVLNGQAVCVCDDGYVMAGDDCILDPCEGESCSGYGSCEVQGGEAICTCDLGYIPGGDGCVEDPCYLVTCSGTASFCRGDSACSPEGEPGNCDLPGDPINEGQACYTACVPEGVCSQGACQGEVLDEDGDGYPPEDCGGIDCDDSDPLVTGKPEALHGSLICENGIDDDCDGVSDSDDPDCKDGLNVCTRDGWYLDSPNPLARVWVISGSAHDDVWFAGGQVFRFDGRRWLLMDDPVPGERGLSTSYDIQVFSRDDAWLVTMETVQHFNGFTWIDHSQDVWGDHPNRLMAFWGAAPDSIWLLSYWGFENENAQSRIHFSSGRHLSTSLVVEGFGLAELGGSGPSDVWAVGSQIEHFDGSRWTTHIVGPLDKRLESVWAFSTDNAWAVGADGGIRHWNGDSWQVRDYGTYDYMKVWGTDPDDLWICGIEEESTTFVHWDGSDFSVELHLEALRCPIGPSVYWDTICCDFWGATADDVWALAGGTVHHWDGRAWVSYDQDFGEDLQDVFAEDNDNLWIAGGSKVIYRDEWTWRDLAEGQLGQGVRAVWAASPQDAWVAGDEGLLAHWDGSTWTSADSPTSMTLRALWGSGPDSVWAVGDAGAALKWDGAAWTTADAGVQADLLDVHGSSDNHVWAVGDDCTVTTWNGSTWTPMDFDGPTDAPFDYQVTNVKEVLAFAEDDVWLRATAELPAEPPDELPIQGCLLFHWDGSDWTEMPVGFFGGDNEPNCALGGSDPQHVLFYIELNFGAWLWRFNGDSWTSYDTFRDTLQGIPFSYRHFWPLYPNVSMGITQAGSMVLAGGDTILRHFGCLSDEDCQADNPCLVGKVCTDGFCTGGTPAPQGTPCDDGLFCTKYDTCGPDGRCSQHNGSPCVFGHCNEDNNNCD
jgi:hypothetical protein